mmetsp:Transcript_96119/g.267075  ORF Transcript_96119/g.267075 Transcript_96119/m.267075 type:complete len:200 (-) Transcript_96119:70-669(-)
MRAVFAWIPGQVQAGAREPGIFFAFVSPAWCQPLLRNIRFSHLAERLALDGVPDCCAPLRVWGDWPWGRGWPQLVAKHTEGREETLAREVPRHGRAPPGLLRRARRTGRRCTLLRRRPAGAPRGPVQVRRATLRPERPVGRCSNGRRRRQCTTVFMGLRRRHRASASGPPRAGQAAATAAAAARGVRAHGWPADVRGRV